MNRRRALIEAQGNSKKYHWDYTQGLTNDIFTIETTGSSTYEITADGLKMNTYGNWEKVYLNLKTDILPLLFEKPFKFRFEFASTLNIGFGEGYWLFMNALSGAFYMTGSAVSKWIGNSRTVIVGNYNKNTFTFGGDYVSNISYQEEANWNGVFSWNYATPTRLFYFHGTSSGELILKSVDLIIG